MADSQQQSPPAAEDAARLIGSILDEPSQVGSSGGTSLSVQQPVPRRSPTATNGEPDLQQQQEGRSYPTVVVPHVPIQRSTSAPPQLHLEGLVSVGSGSADAEDAADEPGAHAFNTTNSSYGQQGEMIVNGETIRADDQRLTPEYYSYYFSQKPLDPRLPPPLMNWTNGHAYPRHHAYPLAHAHTAHTHPQLHVADSPPLGSTAGGASPNELSTLSTLSSTSTSGTSTTIGAGSGTSVDTSFAALASPVSAGSALSPGANHGDSAAASAELETRIATMSLAPTTTDDSTEAVLASMQPPSYAQTHAHVQQQQQQYAPALHSYYQPQQTTNDYQAAMAAAYYSQQQQQQQQGQNYGAYAHRGSGVGVGVNPLLAMMTYQQLLQQSTGAGVGVGGLNGTNGTNSLLRGYPTQGQPQGLLPLGGPDLQAAMASYSAQMRASGQLGGQQQYRQAYGQQQAMYGGVGGGGGGRGQQRDARYGGGGHRGSRHQQHQQQQLHGFTGQDALLGHPSGGGHHHGGHGHHHGHHAPHPASVAAHSWLEEFRTAKAGQTYTLHDVIARGLLIDLCMDQHGSRFVQQRLEVGDPLEVAASVSGLLPEFLRLSHDIFSNYCCQKHLEAASPEQRRAMYLTLRGHVLALSLHMYGCRVIQKALEVTHGDAVTQAWLVAELDGHVMQCVRDQNGNHVIQKVLSTVPPSLMSPIVDVFQGQVLALSIHPYGCRVIQRLLEHCTETQRKYVLDEIIENVDELCRNQYGNYCVLQHAAHMHAAQAMLPSNAAPLTFLCLYRLFLLLLLVRSNTSSKPARPGTSKRSSAAFSARPAARRATPPLPVPPRSPLPPPLVHRSIRARCSRWLVISMPRTSSRSCSPTPGPWSAWSSSIRSSGVIPHQAPTPRTSRPSS